MDEKRTENKALLGVEDKSLRPDFQDKTMKTAVEPFEAPVVDGIEILVAHYNSSLPDARPGDVVRVPADLANSLIQGGVARLQS